jgi:hypothetical protein
MTPRKQLYRHNPPETYGDGARTCIACLLDVAPEEVPNFSELHWEDKPGWDKAESEYLGSKGYARAQFGYSCGLEEMLAYMKSVNPGVYYILLGTSRNGTPHDVICLDDKIVWDPSQDDSGIVGPVEGSYFVTILVPLNMTARTRAPG